MTDRARQIIDDRADAWINSANDEEAEELAIADANAHGPFLDPVSAAETMVAAFEPGEFVKIDDELLPAYELLGSEQILQVMSDLDSGIERLQQRLNDMRDWRDKMAALVATRATEAQQGLAAHGYEVRLNKGRAVTSYDADKIMPHLTAEQKSVACKVSYSLVAPVFAAMLNAGILPEAVNEGVTTKPAVERWEVRKAKGA